MTVTFTPSAVRIADQYADGEDARHYTFEALEPLPHMLVQPGQFFMLSVPGHGEAAFTYVRPPDAQGRFDALIRRTGQLTNALFELGSDAILGVRGPFGRGWPEQAVREPRLLVIAGGCGLAPLASVLNAWDAGAGTRALLLYGSRSEATQVLARERAGWAKRLPVLETFDQPRDPSHARGTPATLLQAAFRELGAAPSCVLSCGPERMLENTAHALQHAGVDATQIFVSIERRMHCGVGLCGHCYVAHGYACSDGPTYRYDAYQALLARSPSRSHDVTEIHHC